MGFVLRQSPEQSIRDATRASIMTVKVLSVVIEFMPFSHPHRAIAPAVFEITFSRMRKNDEFSARQYIVE
jgi:hypothetical protein